MDGWGVLGTALISAAVSLAVALSFRWWERRAVTWKLTGEQRPEHADGKATGYLRADIELHNTGDGDAYNVRTVRCNGADFEPWETFEAGKVASGESIKAAFTVQPDSWRTCWVEVVFASSPTHLKRTTRTGRLYLQPALANVTRNPKPR